MMVLLGVAAALLASPCAFATTADDLCAPSATSCILARSAVVTDGSLLDFGIRAVTLKQGTSLDVGPGRMNIRAGSLTLEPGAALLARGRTTSPSGGEINIETRVGDVRVLASGTTTARIDLTAQTIPGTLEITARGDVDVAGVLAVQATTPGGSGGTITVTADGTISALPGSKLDAFGGGDGIGGTVELVARGALVVGAPINASGGDGGAIDFEAGDTLTTSPTGVLNVNAIGRVNDGGEITLLAGGAITLAGPISGRGTGNTTEGGGFGGFLTVASAASIRVEGTGVIDFSGAPPDGEGGEVDLSADLDLDQRGLIATRGAGTDGAGGVISLSAGRLMTLGPLSTEGGGFGAGEISASAGELATVLGEINADGTGEGGLVEIDAVRVVMRGSVHARGLSGAPGGAIDLVGCDLEVAATGRLETVGPGGRTTLQASGRIIVRSGATLLSGPVNATNLLAHRDRTIVPTIESGSAIDPPPVRIPDPTLPPCIGTPTCGNGVRDPDEECDDFNVRACDACAPTCTVERCGNGILDCQEECDDGNPLDGDGCDTNCTVTRCGNAIRTGVEECDDGNFLSSDGCDLDCTSSRCGNGITTPPREECDEGPLNGLPTSACDAECSFSSRAGCGDRVVGPGENCDDGNGLSCDGCSSACRVEACGNGTVDCGEECDDGNQAACDGCSEYCQFEVCPNGRTDFCEQCDDGNGVSGDGCDVTCTISGCGNAIVTAGEQCDDGGRAPCDGCSPTCRLETCANGVPDCGEECDDGNLLDGDGCDRNCTVTRCGNGIVSASEGVYEECDDGNLVDGDGCDANCTRTRCGNGRTAGTETCDDGNSMSGDGCDANCTRTGCGNDIVTPPIEQCDNGASNGRPDDPCEANCQLRPPPGCGDGRVNVDLGEECDDGNRNACDGCAPNCRRETCGNGSPDCTEQCDDFNTDPCDGCSPACRIEFCGNGIADCREECDDGNLRSGDGCDANCTRTRCGNRVVTVPEECDDGNLVSGDGCDAACRRESTCTGPSCPCTTNCGPTCRVDTDCDPDGQCAGRQCVGGSCTSVAPFDCDDGRAGNLDTCVLDGTGLPQCRHPCFEGSACDDGNRCNGDERCVDRACVAGSRPNCDDNDRCTDDSCDPTQGCVNARKAGFPLALCGLDTADQALQAASPADLSRGLDRKIASLMSRTRAALARAAVSEGIVRRQNKFLKKAQGSLAKLIRIVQKAESRRKLAEELAKALMRGTGRTSEAVSALRAGLVR